MTPNLWDSVTPQDEQDALHSISSMLVGTKVLKDQPGVVYSLAAAKAHPADAQAIDQFMQGLDAEKQVRLAQAAGHKIIISNDMKARLNALNVDYSMVEYTHQDALNAAADAISHESNGKLQAKTDANGNILTDKAGNILTAEVKPVEQHHDNGFGTGFLGMGPLWRGLKNDVVDPAGSVLSKGFNFVNTAISDAVVPGTGAIDPEKILARAASRASDMQAQGYDPTSIWSGLAFEASGKAHGDTSDVAKKWEAENPSGGPLGWSGQQAVSEAERFLNDPTSYRKAIETDPTNFTPSGAMTDAGRQKLEFLSSEPFQKLTAYVQSHTATVGNDIANAIGIDAFKHPTAYALTAAGTNLGVGFAIDPLIILGNAAKAAKIAKIGIDSLGDSRRGAAILDPAVSGPNAVQRGWQRGIDLAQGIKAADNAGDAAKVASLTAKFQAELPGIAALLPDFLGKNMITGWGEELVNGERRAVPIFGDGPGINNLHEAAQYVGSKYALTRLMNGRAAAQESMMPGALSAFGYRKLKGLTAGWMTARSAARQLGAEGAVLSAAKADPALAEKLITEGMLTRISAQADDAINAHSGTVLAHKPLVNLQDGVKATLDDLNTKLSKIDQFGAGDAAQVKSLNGELDDLEERLQSLMSDKKADPAELATLHDKITEARQGLSIAEANVKASKAASDATIQSGMKMLDESNAPQMGQELGNLPAYKSATDAERLAVTPAGKGDIARNLRATGNPLGEGRIGWASPTAIAARGRLAAQRLSTLLPRNTMIDINDAASGEKIYKLAMTYLNRGDANALRAAWNLGDGGQRKAIIGALIDQLGHAAGLGKTETGQRILNEAKTSVEAYSSTGDEIILNGQNLALHAGQVRTVWTLPTFQALQQASSKIGLWEATMGRALTSKQADLLMSQWKLGALLKPSTITRNQLEGWARTALEGQFGEAVRARAVLTTPNRELWEHGLSPETKKEYDALLAAGKEQEAEKLARSNMLSGEILGRSTPTTKLAELAPFALAGRAYRALTGKMMDEEHVQALLTLGKDELSTVMEEYGQQFRQADLGTRRAAREAGEIAKAGYGPSKIRYFVNKGARRGDKEAGQKVRWTQQDVDGTHGADRFSNALAMRVNATPNVARAVIQHLEGKGSVDDVIAALDDPQIAQRMAMTGYGRLTWDTEEGLGDARVATSDAERLIGKRAWANRVIEDYRHLLTGQNGVYQKKLADQIATTGRAPSSEWITKYLKHDNRPEGVLAREVEAMPNGGVRSLPQTLQDIEGGAYQWLVERPLQRTTSAPVFMANYARARVGLNPMVDQMVEQGISREAAENMAKELSIKSAWVKAEQLIDDPGQKTQFDVIARNMFPFSRATQAMIRRWGGGLWQDPTRARKMMLAYEGAVQSGLVYDNAYGEPTFTYPGSGVLNMTMRELSKIPGFESLNYFPVSSSMTGGVLMAVPGADNPFRMSMGPMMSIPMRELFNLFPDHRAMLDEIDSYINGPIGVGETGAQLVPTAIRKFYTAMDENSRNSAFASAAVGAIANLAAGGVMPKPDASPSERDAFIQRVKTQTRNQLFLRAIFGLFAPAAPSAPSEGTSASQADYAFHITGIGQLSDEYKQILNETGDVARANAIWAAIHPDTYVWKDNQPTAVTMPSAETVPHSRAITSKAYLPATNEALNWMESHSDLINEYKSVAAYFLPLPTGNAPFNDRAYQTQIELGLRQKKTPTEFYNDFRIRGAESVFYPAVQGFDQRIAEAKQAHNQQLVNAWTTAKSNWETDFKNKNPLFQSKIDAYPDARATALGQLADLHRMLKEGKVPDGQAPLLNLLVTNYDNYASFISKYKGQDKQSIAIRDAALQAFNGWAQQAIPGSPLADLYAGVFRTLNTNLVDLTNLTGATS